MTCYIIDNNPIECLEKCIEQTTNLTLVGRSADLIIALEDVRNTVPDLIFLDAKMAEHSNLHFWDLFPPRTLFIFMGENVGCAINAFHNGAIGFLLKPLDFSCFYKTVIKAKQLLHKRLWGEHNGQSHKIFIPAGAKGRIIQLDSREIIYIKSQNNLSYVITTEQSFIANIRLKEAERVLHHLNFARVHRAFIVNIDFINIIDGTHLHLNNAVSIPFGDFYRHEFLSRIDNKCIKKYI